MKELYLGSYLKYGFTTVFTHKKHIVSFALCQQKKTNKIKRTIYKGRISENNTTRAQFRILLSNPGRLKVSETV